MTPNTIIIRVEDVDGSKTFLHLPLDANGFIDGANANEFQVYDGDSYNLLEFNQMVMAVSNDAGDSSIELARIDIIANDTGLPVVLHEDPQQVAIMVKHLFDEYQSGAVNGQAVPQDD